MSQNKTNFAVPLAFVGMMFFAIGFALGINSFLIPVLKGALSLPSGVAYLLLAATFVPFLIFGYPASATIAKIGYLYYQLNWKISFFSSSLLSSAVPPTLIYKHR